MVDVAESASWLDNMPEDTLVYMRTVELLWEYIEQFLEGKERSANSNTRQ